MNLSIHSLYRALAGLALAGVAALAPAADAQEAAAPAAPSPLQPAAPVGAIWVSTAGSFYRDTPRIDHFIANLRAMPFREAIIQVVDNHSAFYDSAILPRAIGVPEQFDPLLTLTKGLRGQSAGMKVIAWINPYAAGNVSQATPFAAAHVATAHPEWLSLRAGGAKTDDGGNMYLEAGLPEVQQHLEEVVRELAKRYLVDGIYFDPMGDPGEDWGFHPAMITAWQRKTGKQGQPIPGEPSWVEFRAEVYTKALAGLAAAARSARSSLIVSAGASTDGPPPLAEAAFRHTPVYLAQHQDWPAWLRATPALSRVYLKDFKNDENEPGDYEGWMRFALEAARQSRTQVVVGVAGYQNESVTTLAQMRKAAEAGARGIALADFEKPVRDSDAQAPFLSALSRTIFSPDYLATLPGAGSLRALAQTSATQPATAPATAATSAPLATNAAEPPVANDDLALPPPPPGSRYTPPAAAAKTAPDAGATQDLVGSGEVTVRSQRTITGMPDDADSAGMNHGPSGLPASRRQMLEELINDPEFNQSNDWTLIRPGEKYKAYLKEKFGNIFSEEPGIKELKPDGTAQTPGEKIPEPANTAPAPIEKGLEPDDSK